MNLHAYVSPYVGVVNPLIPGTIRPSTGASAPSARGKRTPRYATPTAFIGTIADGVLTVISIFEGVLAPGQTISGLGIPANISIVGQLTGSPGGVGTYEINGPDG